MPDGSENYILHEVEDAGREKVNTNVINVRAVAMVVVASIYDNMDLIILP